MNSRALSLPLTLAIAGVLALSGCDGGGDDDRATAIGPTPDGRPAILDDAPVSAASATGLWKLHYDWKTAPPESWTTFYGPAASGDLDVAIPSEAQKRGMFAAETTWGFAPMTSTIGDGNVKWTFSLASGDGSSFTLDFVGSGTGSALDGTASFSNAPASATWTATKVTAPLLVAKDLAGDWTLDFQWSRRTPGQLLVTCDAGGSCTIPGGQSGGPTTDEAGVATLKGNQLTLKLPNSTHVGVVTSDRSLWGYMDASDGSNTGVWTARRGKPAASPPSNGCTHDVDCGSCQRCERSTGRCISRLSC